MVDTPATISMPPSAGTTVSFLDLGDGNGNVALQSVPRVNSAPVSTANPMPVTDAAAETSLASAVTALEAIETATAAGATSAGQALALSILTGIETAQGTGNASLETIATNTGAGATAANQTTMLTDLAAIVAKLNATLTTSLAAGTNAIGSVTVTGTPAVIDPATTYQGTMALAADTSTALVSGSVTMASDTVLPATFGKVTVINTGSNIAYIFWVGGTASATGGGEPLAPGASDTVNLGGSGTPPSFFSPAGTTLAFRN